MGKPRGLNKYIEKNGTQFTSASTSVEQSMQNLLNKIVSEAREKDNLTILTNYIGFVHFKLSELKHFVEMTDVRYPIKHLPRKKKKFFYGTIKWRKKYLSEFGFPLSKENLINTKTN